jgi:S-adenosylmethionine/arginine decarboxylase-like enzyme
VASAPAPPAPPGGAPPTAPAFTHVLADLIGVSAAQLCDAALLGGLLIAAASAAGLASHGAPVMRVLPHDGVAGLFLLDGCHIALHAFPAEGLLLVDVLARAGQDAGKAVDVFARRLHPRAVHTARHARG